MIRRLVRKLLAALREEGVVAAARKVWRHLIDYVLFGRRRRRQLVELERSDAFDATYGTDTASLVLTEDLGVREEETEHAVLYWPSRRRTVERALESLDIDHGRFAFVDLGSGKGRVLLMASFYPYRRIVGVEFSEKLHAIARRNVEIFDPPERRCGTIELHRQDAATFVFPDEPLVVYLFDPFDEHVLGPVLGNLEASIRANPREAWIVYLHARFRALVDASSLFELVAESPRSGPKRAPLEYDFCIYRALRASGAGPARGATRPGGEGAGSPA